MEGLSAYQRKALLDKSMDRAETILADCHGLGLRIMTIQDGDYPDRLRQIPDPPAVLYLRGRSFDFDEEAAIGVVGAREPSEYGRKMAARLGLPRPPLMTDEAIAGLQLELESLGLVHPIDIRAPRTKRRRDVPFPDALYLRDQTDDEFADSADVL